MTEVIAFEYLYRDAANYKVHASLCLDGSLGEAPSVEVATLCHAGKFFVAEQIGIPPLYEELWRLSGGPTEADHAFHEFVELREATEEEVREPPVWGTLDELLQAFRSVKKWDVKLSPNCAT